jgi:hypothetical protein
MEMLQLSFQKSCIRTDQHSLNPDSNYIPRSCRAAAARRTGAVPAKLHSSIPERELPHKAKVVRVLQQRHPLPFFLKASAVRTAP